MTVRLQAIPLALAGLALVALAGVVLAENVDPANDNSQFAWSENAGWLNAEPANCSDCGLHVGATGLTGYIWGENLGWVNLSCQNNSTCGGPAGNWGVARNPATGALSGYAWAENAGWINFSCQTNNACAGPAGNWGVTISPSTGIFSGHAWGENIGWISFSDTAPVAYRVQTHPDTDGDGTLNDADPEDDGDGYTDADEALIGTGALDRCGMDGWPSNLHEPDPPAAPEDKLDVQDLLSFLGPVRRLDSSPGDVDRFDARWDLVPGPGVLSKHINIQDILALIGGTTGYPPMFGAERAFNRTCLP